MTIMMLSQIEYNFNVHTQFNFNFRSFERAFQIYQSEQFLKEIHEKKTNKENIESQNNAANIKQLISNGKESVSDGLLIDLDDGPQLNHLYSKERNRDFLQTAWVSFE